MKIVHLLLILCISIYAKDFQSIKLTEFTKIVSNTSDKNIVISDTVQKDFSIFLPDFDFKNQTVSIKLLKEILDVNQLSYREFDNIILIYKDVPLAEKKSEEKPVHNPFVIKYQFLNVKELQAFLISLYPDLKFTYLKNRVFFNSTNEEYQLISEYIAMLDASYLEASLYINVLSTSNSVIKDIGTDFDYSSIASKNEVSSFFHIITSSAKFETVLPDPTKFFGFINLLHTKGLTNLIQNPRVTLRDGSDSTLESVVQIPFLQATVSTSSSLNQTQNSFQYKDVGLKLNVTNVFITNDVFTFDLEISIESITEKSNTPTVSKKKLKSSISLKDNKPFIIAGLNTTDNFESITNIPIIEYIPLINKLTEHKKTDNKNETFTIILNTDFFKDKNASL